MRSLLISCGALLTLIVGLVVGAFWNPGGQAARYQQLSQRWHMAGRGKASTEGQQRTGISKAIWFGEGAERRQMVLEAQSGQFQIVEGRLVEQMQGVHGIWQERFLGDASQLIEEFDSNQALYDYGRRELESRQVRLARWQATGRRLDAKDSSRTPLMRAVAETVTVHIGAPPRLEAQALHATVFQAPS